jgi:hypothetical protein
MQARTLTIRLVRLAMAASLLAPTMLFAFAAWNSYRNLAALTDERLARSLDVEQEEAQRTFQLVDLALNSVKDLVATCPPTTSAATKAPSPSTAKADAQIRSSNRSGSRQGRAIAGFFMDRARPTRALPTATFFAPISAAMTGPITAGSTRRASVRSRSSR